MREAGFDACGAAWHMYFRVFVLGRMALLISYKGISSTY